MTDVDHAGGTATVERVRAEERPAAPVVTRLPAILAPLRERNFRLLWLGESISWLGDQFYFVALAWLALTLTHSGLAIGTLFLVAYVPRLALMLLGGALSDRLPKRAILVIADVLRGILMLVVAALAWSGRLELWHLYVLSGLFGVADAFVFPAYNALVATLLDEGELTAGNALLQGSLRLANLLGPAPAGLLITVLGSAAAFAGDALTFFFCAGTVWAMSAYLERRAAGRAWQPRTESRHGDLLGLVREGLLYGWRDPVMRPLLLIVAVVYFASVGPLYVGVPLLADRNFIGGAAAALGTLMSAFGGGSLLGIVIAGLARIGRRRRAGWILGVSAWLGAGLMLLAAVQSLALAALLIASMGLASGFVSVITIAWFQERVEAGMRGRVMGLVTLASSGISPISLGAAALLAGPHLVGMFVGAGGLVIGIALLLARSSVLRSAA